MQTEIIDKLYLELATVVSPETKSGRELKLERELGQWQQYAAYLRSCALSGESDPHDFDAFLAKSEPSLA